LVPKLPRETGNTYPLIDTVNNCRVRIKERLPGMQNKIKPFDEPRTIAPNIVFVKTEANLRTQPFPSSMYSTAPLTCFQSSFVLAIMRVKGRISPQSLAKRHKAKSSSKWEGTGREAGRLGLASSSRKKEVSQWV